MIPPYEVVVLIPRELGPLAVPPEFEDVNGHMNIRHYFDLGSQAISDIYDRFGVTDTYRDGGLGFFTVENNARYHAECRVGDAVSVHVVSERRTPKAVHSTAFIVNDTTRLLACSFTSVAIHVDLRTRRSVAMGQQLQAQVDAVTAPLTPQEPLDGA